MKKFYNILLCLSPFLFLGILLLLLFWSVFFQGYVFVDGDNFHLNMPLKYILVDAFHNGYFPLWNSYILGGIPYAADLNLGTFNPLNGIYLFFSVERALTIQAVIELFLIGCFQYLFLKIYKLRNNIALFGSIIFMLSGTVFLFTTNSAVLHPIVYIPLLFLFAKRYFQEKKLQYFIFFILAQVLQIISGHPQLTYYTMIFISLYILFQQTVPLKKRFVVLVTYVFTSVLISSFQLIPFFEYVMHSSRPIASLSYASSGSVGLPQLLTIFFPTFFGTKLYGTWWGSQATLMGYVGVISLLFLFLGIRSSKFKEKKFYVISLVLTFLLSLGKLGILFFFFYYLFPGWSLFRSPADILVITTFCVSILASFGLKYIIDNYKKVHIPAKLFFITTSMTIMCGFLVLYGTWYVNWETIFVFFSQNLSFIGKILVYSPIKIQSIVNGVVQNFFLFSLFLFIVFSLKRFVKNKNLFIALCIFLLSIDLFFVDRTYLQLAHESFYHISFPQEKMLRDPEYRIFANPVVIEHDRKILPGPNFFYIESRRNLLALTDNHVIPEKLYSVTGYTSLVLKNYAEFVSQSNTITGVDSKNFTGEQLNQLGVRFIISTNEQGNTVITENTSALPRAHLLQLDEGSLVVIKSSQPNKIIIDSETTDKNTLVLSDNYYPGWKAFVNNKETSITPYKDVFRQITVPQGKSEVVFFYDPISWKIGAGLSFVGIFVLFICIYKRRYYE